MLDLQTTNIEYQRFYKVFDVLDVAEALQRQRPFSGEELYGEAYQSDLKDESSKQEGRFPKCLELKDNA
jgi:hypothetical protein